MVISEWEIKSLDKVSQIIDCKHRTPKYVSSGIPVVSPGTIKWGAIDLKSPTKRVTEAEYKSLMDHCSVDLGDLVLSRNQSVGIVSYVDKIEPFVLGQDTVLIKPNCADSRFLFYRFQSTTTQRLIFKLAGGSTFSRINLGDIRKLKGIYPPLPEQRKIAQILRTWDKAISTTESLIANSQQQKKSLMQQLLTGKKWFEGEWIKLKLGGVSEITTGSSNRQDSILEGKYTFFDRSEDIRTSNQYLFEGEAVIVAGEGQDFIPKYFKGKFDLHQRTYAIMNFDKVDGKFLFYYITYFRHYFLSQAVGSTVKSLRLPMFKKMPLLVPATKEEQQKIASVLTTADQEIDTLQQKLAYLKQEKKALMQQLLTGKRRVMI